MNSSELFQAIQYSVPHFDAYMAREAGHQSHLSQPIFNEYDRHVEEFHDRIPEQTGPDSDDDWDDDFTDYIESVIEEADARSYHTPGELIDIGFDDLPF